MKIFRKKVNKYTYTVLFDFYVFLYHSAQILPILLQILANISFTFVYRCRNFDPTFIEGKFLNDSYPAAQHQPIDTSQFCT